MTQLSTLAPGTDSPLPSSPHSGNAFGRRDLTGAGIAKSSARIQRISLTTWGRMLAGEPPPTGPAPRGAKPPDFPVAAIDHPALPEVFAGLAAPRADEMDADNVNREPSIARGAIGWWQRRGWIECDPTIGIERRPAPPDRTRALAENQIAALWRLDVALREKTRWKMVYECAAWADEVPCLNVEDLYPQDRRGGQANPLAVRHRPAPAPPHRPPHLRPAGPHRPQGPGRRTHARCVPWNRPGPSCAGHEGWSSPVSVRRWSPSGSLG
ncbi:hypothetical protein [Streptomyces sp. NPDC051704]|uniref:hypothetical protein n=1 Tax=Streptomyces sp. NPDC051704 TaxID=3365671 RepID=UPI003794C564